MLGSFQDPVSRTRRTDAEVFAERIAAAERGEEYEPEPEPFDISTLGGLAGMRRGPMMPRPGVN
jgi:hypothetical protein